MEVPNINLKEKLKPYGVKKRKLYTVSETITNVYIYKVKAITEKEAIDKLKSGEALQSYNFTTDTFYQIEE